MPAMDDGVPGHGGCTATQFFCRLTGGTAHGYPVKTEKQVGQAFEDHICEVGMSVGLKSDNAKLESCGCLSLIVSIRTKAERKIQDVKRFVNDIMDCVGHPLIGSASDKVRSELHPVVLSLWWLIKPPSA